MNHVTILRCRSSMDETLTCDAKIVVKSLDLRNFLSILCLDMKLDKLWITSSSCMHCPHLSSLDKF